MEIGVPDDRLPVRARPGDRPLIEVHPPRVHRVHFQRVDEIRIASRPCADGGRDGIERVGRDHQARRMPALEQAKLLEAAHLSARRRVVHEQQVAPFDTALDPRHEDDAVFLSVVPVPSRVVVAIVQRDGERAVPQRPRALDQLAGAVADVVGRIQVRMSVEFDFEHGGPGYCPIDGEDNGERDKGQGRREKGEGKIRIYSPAGMSNLPVARLREPRTR